MKIDLRRTISEEKIGDRKSRKCGHQHMRHGEMHIHYSVKHRRQTEGQEEEESIWLSNQFIKGPKELVVVDNFNSK